MVDVVLSLAPLALGVVMSPLAIMALVAVLLSRKASSNGAAFLAGWTLAVALGVGGSFFVLGLLEVRERAAPPLWVPVVRLLLSALLIAAAAWIYVRGKRHVLAMATADTPLQVAAAAPQLPGWLQSVDTFSPGRSFFLGLGIFLLNPVDLSCAVLAALDVRLGGLEPSSNALLLVLFCLVSIAPIAIPVVLVTVRGSRADPALHRVRTWIASHTTALNAALVLVIALLQLQKGISGLLAY